MVENSDAADNFVGTVVIGNAVVDAAVDDAVVGVALEESRKLSAMTSSSYRAAPFALIVGL